MQHHLLKSQPKNRYLTEEDVLMHCFQYLPPKDVLRVSLVNHVWHEMASSNVLWKHMTERAIKIRFSFDGPDDEDEFHTSKDYQRNVVDWRKLYHALIHSRWRWRRGLRHSGDRYDHFFKVLILGDKKVGKSSLLMRMVKQDIEPDVINEEISKYDMSHKTCTVVDVMPPNTAVKLQIYDSNIIDMATYVKSCRKYSCCCHAVVIVYNVAQKRTFFNAINKWLAMIRNQQLSCNVFLVANKSDMRENKHQVTRREAETIAHLKGLYFLEVSALRGIGTEDLISSIANITYRRIVEKAATETRWPDILAAKYSPDQVRIFYTLMQVPKRTILQDDTKFDNDYTESALSASTTEEDEEEDEDYNPNAIIEDENGDFVERSTEAQDFQPSVDDTFPEDDFYDLDDPNAMEYVSLSQFNKQDLDYFKSLQIDYESVPSQIEIQISAPSFQGISPPSNISPLNQAIRRNKHGGSTLAIDGRSSSRPTSTQPIDEFSAAESHAPTVQLASVSRKGKRRTKRYVSDILIETESDADTVEADISHMSQDVDSDTLKKIEHVIPAHLLPQSIPSEAADTSIIDGTGLNDAIIMQAVSTETNAGGKKKKQPCILS